MAPFNTVLTAWARQSPFQFEESVNGSLDRQTIGIELSEEYAEIARARILDGSATTMEDGKQ